MSPTPVINGPHLRAEKTTRSIMLHVSISLIPALLGAVYFFGIRAFYLTGLSVAVCVSHRIPVAEAYQKACDCRRFQRSCHRNAPGL